MKIKDGVELIDGTMAHTYSIEYGGRIYLVDSGTKGSAKKISRYYREADKKPDAILITHYHMDHIGGLDQLMREFSPEVYVPGPELRIIRREDPLPEDTPSFLKMFGKIPVIEGAESLKRAEDLNSEGVKIVETFGHTPGSTSYVFTDLGVICVGDAVYNRKGALALNRMFSLDLEKAEESRKKIMSLKPIMVLPGHGDPVSI